MFLRHSSHRIDFVKKLIVTSNLSFFMRKLVVVGALLLSGVIFSACSSGTTSIVTDNNVNLATSITLDKAATVPVLDGKATLAGIYVHNNTGKLISGIRYASVDTGHNVSSSQINVINLTNCTTIAANSSCLVRFTTPSLAVGQSVSTLIDVSYNGQHSKQLINYRYYKSNDYTGVNFSDNSATLYGTNDYATIYAFVGKSQSQNKVGFNANNPSLAVSEGLNNGSIDIAPNQVIPLEIKSNANVTSNLVSLMPYTVTNSKQLARSLQTAIQQNQTLEVTISPTQQANLLMSDVPILNARGESTTTITLINNGNQPAMNLSLTSADSSKVSVTSAINNPCSNGGSLEVGASCNYQLSLVDLYNNGSSSLNLAYNNSITNLNTSQNVNYYNNLAEPMISVVPTSNAFNEDINMDDTLVFNVQNIGNAPLNNLIVSLSKTLTHATLSETNTCAATLDAQASCIITVKVGANENVDSGIFYAKLNGSFDNGTIVKSYSFISPSVATHIIDPTIATISSTTPQNATSNVSSGTNIALSFSKAMDPTTLNVTNIQLQKVSDSSGVALTFQGVTNNNQTVTFVQSGGTLSNASDYKIVINPRAIKDYNGNSIGETSSQVVSTFTTGNSSVPTISSVNPSMGVTNQSKTPTINITFSDPMNPASLIPSNITLKTSAGVDVTGTSITISNNNQTATVNLGTTSLSDTTTYQLILNEVNLTSSAGVALGIDTAYVATSFTTGDFTAPTLSSTVPLNGATGVAVESPISLTFSEAMDTSTLTTTTVKLQRVSDSTYVNLNVPSFSNGDKTATFQPVSSLTAGESYNIVINPSAIKDVAGNIIGVATSQTVTNFAVLKDSFTDFILGGENGITGFISSSSSSAIEFATPYASYYAVAQSPNGNYIAVGQNGSIMISNTNASSWTAVTSGITDNLYAISCGSSNCVAVGEKGKIIYSSDNGETWNVATNSITSAALGSVSCSGSNCLATVHSAWMGSDVWMLRSIDSGKTWSNATPSGFTNGFNSVSCTDSYCVASVKGVYTGGGFTTRNVFFRTADWGNTWSVKAPNSWNTSSPTGYAGVSCFGQKCLSSFGSTGVTAYSADGGITWIQRTDNSGINIGKKLSCTSTYCIAYQPNDSTTNNLLKTTNFGTSWTNVTTGTSQLLLGLQCNLTNCIAVGELSIAIQSTNSGSSWATSNPSSVTSGYIGRISCSEHTYCIGIGPVLTSNGHRAIMRSIDAGTSWRAIDSGSEKPLLDVSCYSNNCLIVTPDSVLSSTDRGQSWSDITPAILTGNDIVGVSCTNNTCVVGGVNSSDYTPFAMYSLDNGGTWLASTSIQSKDFTPSNLSCSGSVCNSVGYNSSYTGALLRSIDGGATWSQVTIPSNFVPASISCSGIYCASVGTLDDLSPYAISSSDSGLTWVLSNSLLPPDVYSIACGGANCIIIAGGITIVRSKNGGLDWGDAIEQPLGAWRVHTAAVY